MIVTIDRRRKAAIVVQCLLSRGDAPPLSDLPEDVQVDLTRELGRLRLVDRATLDAIATEFADDLEALGFSARGGTEAALAALGAHISPAAAARLKAEALGAEGADPWATLAALPPPTLVAILEAESVEVGAVLLSKLPVARAAEVLGLLPGERARRVAFAVSRTAGIAPAAVARIGRALASEHGAPPPAAFLRPPPERLGAILNSSAAATRDGLLDGLTAEDGGFAAQVRRAIFTFAHLPRRLRPTDVPRVLRPVDARVVATALATARAAGGPEGEAADFVLASVSQRMGDGIREEIEGLGPIKPADGEAAQAAVVVAARALAESGEIVLIDPEEE